MVQAVSEKPAPAHRPARVSLPYLVLAVFNVATISFSLWLNDRLTHQYSTTLDHGRIWSERSRRLARFDEYAGEMAYAASDVFVTRDPEGARQKINHTRREFMAAIEYERHRREGLRKPEHLKWLDTYLLSLRNASHRPIKRSRSSSMSSESFDWPTVTTTLTGGATLLLQGDIDESALTAAAKKAGYPRPAPFPTHRRRSRQGGSVAEAPAKRMTGVMRY